MLKRVTAATLFVLMTRLQGADAPPQFEVATLKIAPHPGESYQINLGTISGGQLRLTNTTLSDCIRFAYGLASNDQIFGTDWIKDKTVLFDIVAKVDPETPREKVLAMTQFLLADRLKLVLHPEKKELRYLALTAGKNGPKMSTANDLSPQSRNNSAGRGRVTGNQVSMPLLASFLSRSEHQLIVDNTGLAGAFQVQLKWSPDTGTLADAGGDGSDNPSLYTALQEQLGLQLKPTRGPVDVLVVDHAERMPAEN
jgi:uncharacterized protein (TIGR03435 family)